MEALVSLVWVVVSLALVGAVLWWASAVLRRRGGSAVVAPLEEVWRPTAYAAHEQVRSAARRAITRPAVGGRSGWYE